MTFLVMRSPSTMEDNGRYEYIGKYPTYEEANKAISKQVQKSKGYFKEGSFTIFIDHSEVDRLKGLLNRCFRGEVIEVRNELILESMKKQTERLLALPPEKLREYLDGKTRG
jgi:hypothetical protein